MAQPVILKSHKYGINLILDPALPFEELLGHILDKFLESEQFFKNSKIALAFDGRKLSEEEEYRILDAIAQKTSIHVVCIIDYDEEKEAYAKQKIEQFLADESDNTGKFYKGTLRCGQVFESNASIVIIGDVNPGAKIISTGNIVILGALHGTAYAGAAGNEKCFVVALEMNPAQVKIGSIIGRSADKGFLSSIRERKKTVIQPQAAIVSNGHILIEPITKHTFNNIL